MQENKGIIYSENGKRIFDIITGNSVILEFSPWSTEGVKPIAFPNLSEGGWERYVYTLPWLNVLLI